MRDTALRNALAWRLGLKAPAERRREGNGDEWQCTPLVSQGNLVELNERVRLLQAAFDAFVDVVAVDLGYTVEMQPSRYSFDGLAPISPRKLYYKQPPAELVRTPTARCRGKKGKK